MAAEPSQSEARHVEAVLDWLDKRRYGIAQVRARAYRRRFVDCCENLPEPHVDPACIWYWANEYAAQMAIGTEATWRAYRSFAGR